MTDKYKKEWVENWDNETIVSQAVSLGLWFMAKRISTEDLEHNKKMLIDKLDEK